MGRFIEAGGFSRPPHTSTARLAIARRFCLGVVVFAAHIPLLLAGIGHAALLLAVVVLLTLLPGTVFLTSLAALLARLSALLSGLVLSWPALLSGLALLLASVAGVTILVVGIAHVGVSSLRAPPLKRSRAGPTFNVRTHVMPTRLPNAVLGMW
jgi:hypothetical protein